MSSGDKITTSPTHSVFDNDQLTDMNRRGPEGLFQLSKSMMWRKIYRTKEKEGNQMGDFLIKEKEVDILDESEI